MPTEVIGLCAELEHFSEPQYELAAARVRTRLEPVTAQLTSQPRPSIAASAAPGHASDHAQSDGPANLPSAEWLRRLAMAVLETTHSLRQVQQLRAVASPVVVEQLNRRRHPHLRGRAVSVSTLRVTQVRRGVLEVGCTFAAADHFYPMAFRMELTTSGWRLTACDIGPH